MNLRILDWLRGLAALYVVMYHATGLLWSGASQDVTSPVGAMARQVFGHGHEAVVLFFLISGFCIHYRQAQTGADRIDIPVFAWRRFRRLYPPLLLALAATAVFDSLGHQFTPTVYARTTAYATINTWVVTSYDPATLIGNLFGQGRLLVPAFGSDGPLWSLSFEFWFYVLYPLTLHLFRRVGVRTTLLGVTALSLASQLSSGLLLVGGWAPGTPVLGPLAVVFDWPAWVLGAAVAEGYARDVHSATLRRYGPLLVPVLGVFAAVSPFGRFSDLGAASVFGVAFAYLMLECGGRAWRVPAALQWALQRLGDISYSLYLVHFPFFVLVAAWCIGTRGALPEGAELAVLAIGPALVLGWIAWWLVERHCTPRGSANARAQMERTRASTLLRQPLSPA